MSPTGGVGILLIYILAMFGTTFLAGLTYTMNLILPRFRANLLLLLNNISKDEAGQCDNRKNKSQAFYKRLVVVLHIFVIVVIGGLPTVRSLILYYPGLILSQWNSLRWIQVSHFREMSWWMVLISSAIIGGTHLTLQLSISCIFVMIFFVSKTVRNIACHCTENVADSKKYCNVSIIEVGKKPLYVNNKYKSWNEYTAFLFNFFSVGHHSINEITENLVPSQ